MSDPINRMVIDISHHNSPVDFGQVQAAGIFGIIHKASEGTSFVDDQYLSRAREALNCGLLWGAYHFANSNSVQAQVDNFLKVVGVDDETLYALDWEDNGNSTMRLDQAREFVELLERKIGEGRTVLYSGNTAKEALGSKQDPFWGARRLWLCQYGSTPVCQASWDTYWLWQYSDGEKGPGPHGCPGVSGDCDTNSWPGTVDELRSQWAGMAAPKPHPKRPAVTVEIETIGDVAVTVLVNGVLHSSTS